MKVFKFLLCSVILAIISNVATGAEYTWVQYAADNKLIARTIVETVECPTITIDGKLAKMKLRAEKNDLELKQKIIICEHDVTSAYEVKIANEQLKLPPKKVNRFVVIGDTGCENSFFDKHHRKQKCDPKNWPFKEVADKVAQLNPDFIIHTGDYIYRNKYSNAEDAIKNKQMQWFFFKEDFFDPAQKMLKQAPMLFMRGNHESCKLGGDGWFAFFEPRDFAKCSDYTDSYNVSINDLNFIVFDSAGSINGTKYPQEQLKKYQENFVNIYQNIYAKHWLLIHQPVITLKKLADDEAFVEKLHAMVVQESFKAEYSQKIPVSISGHYHVMAEIERPSTNFTQLIIGNGGTNIHQSKENQYKLIDDGDKVIANINYGYTVFDRLGAHLWKVTSYDLKGNILFVTNLSTK